MHVHENVSAHQSLESKFWDTAGKATLRFGYSFSLMLLASRVCLEWSRSPHCFLSGILMHNYKSAILRFHI